MFTLAYINFREREMNPDRSFSLAIVLFCDLLLILLSAESLWGGGACHNIP